MLCNQPLHTYRHSHHDPLPTGASKSLPGASENPPKHLILLRPSTKFPTEVPKLTAWHPLRHTTNLASRETKKLVRTAVRRRPIHPRWYHRTDPSLPPSIHSSIHTHTVTTRQSYISTVAGPSRCCLAETCEKSNSPPGEQGLV
ncbi:hypothetical protein IF1G_03844 [Cordyceps javanica]|uniref:Uncharacterized protein n=1 Tax=Cordyceps javanica TaxID=43265 RepID=A0A545V8P3_9HYPO|nr:hypothetical protein IF1G_03844 [Cordyceps javanica]